MEHLDYWLIAFLLAVFSAAIGWFAATHRSHQNIIELHQELTSAKTKLQALTESSETQKNLLSRARTELANVFASLSSEALKHNSDEFLKLARENLTQFQQQAQNDLGKKEQAIETLFKPVREALTKTEEQIRALENERKQAYGAITKHLESMAETQRSLQGETRNLVNALRRPEVRGRWGELTLKRLVELSGMVNHCDFVLQEQVVSDSGSFRPDMVIRLPGRKEIIVDAKTPLDAYLSAIETTDPESASEHLRRHAQNVRQRVRELAAKSYWEQFSDSPDFVVLFVPGEQFLSAAFDNDPMLLEDALAQRVILATPSSLVALLRAIAFGWQQEHLAENAARVSELGSELHRRIATFTEHLIKLGRQLTSSVESYNRAVGSLEHQVLPSARRFADLGVPTAKPIDSLQPLTVALRNVNPTISSSEDIDTGSMPLTQ